jgi:chromosome segregation ATPase
MENNDRFQELEEKLLKVAEAFKQTREEKQAREAELEKLREASQEESQQVAEKEREIQALKADLQRIPALERELQGLRREREDVRARVEKMIRQIDALTKTDALG